jgi:hypothetical protein
MTTFEEYLQPKALLPWYQENQASAGARLDYAISLAADVFDRPISTTTCFIRGWSL